MTALYEIITELQKATGSNAKAHLLAQHKDNELLKAYMKATYDPAISYYQTKIGKYVKRNGDYYAPNFDTEVEMVDEIRHELADRKRTGTSAAHWLAQLNHHMTDDWKELLKLLIKRSIGAGVGDTMVLKTWPDLYFIPPYQRCSLMDDKIKARFNALSKFYVQPKLDGSFMYLVKDVPAAPEAITRAGSKYPTWFSERLAIGVPDDFVGVGEAEVFRITNDGNGRIETLLSRQEGNGILNSVLSGGDEDDFFEYSFRLTVWDLLTVDELLKGKSDRQYESRLHDLQNLIYDYKLLNVKLIETIEVSSLAEAMAIYSSYTANGLEGAVIKNPASKWKNGTATDVVKLKIAFEAEYVVTDMYEGTGKAKGMMGGLTIATSDGKLSNNLGTGFDDEFRKWAWANRDVVIGSIITVIANDIIFKRGSDVASLFLPVYSDRRFDKTVADSFEQVQAILAAAKAGI